MDKEKAGKGLIFWVGLWKCIGKVPYVLSGEFFLEGNANGGGVVVVRSLFTATLLFLFAIFLLEILDPKSIWSFSGADLAMQVRDKLGWFGGIFAAVYAALYTRFTTQWGYLGGLYNTLMVDTSRTSWFDDRSHMDKGLAERWAAFIEDAEELHLAMKLNYAHPINYLLQTPTIREAYMEGRPNGEERLNKLKRRIDAAIGSWQQGGAAAPAATAPGTGATIAAVELSNMNMAMHEAKRAAEASVTANEKAALATHAAIKAVVAAVPPATSAAEAPPA